jgi:hypothetical protein
MKRVLVATGCAVLAGAATTGTYVGLVTGRLTLDLGLGRRTRPLGPLHLDIAAPARPSTLSLLRRTPIGRRGPCRRKSRSSSELGRWF